MPSGARPTHPQPTAKVVTVDPRPEACRDGRLGSLLRQRRHLQLDPRRDVATSAQGKNAVGGGDESGGPRPTNCWRKEALPQRRSARRPRRESLSSDGSARSRWQRKRCRAAEMKSTPDQLAQRLAAELGAGSVSLDADLLTSHCVDGKQPALVCTPDREQVSAALRLCAEADATVSPWGGGTAMALGNPPRQVEVVLNTGRLDRVIDHDPANLTVTAESGISLAALQQLLADQRQFVPVDPPFPERSTVGGIVAANLNGPRRSYYGSVRDLVIGMKVSLISGERIKAGGKVVKNVAGYDMCKLFVGSLGTLGVITEVTLRLAPLPESSETARASGTLAQAQKFADELLHSPLLPAAVVLLQGQAPECWQIAARFEGFAELTEMANSRGGQIIIFAAPSDLKHGLEVWGLSPPTLPLMRRIKHQFDPAGLLNPGRFVGSL